MKTTTTNLSMLVTVALLLTALLSCNKKGPEIDPSQTLKGQLLARTVDISALKIEHNWLYFENIEEFRTLMELLHEKYAADQLPEWEKGIQDFTSWRSVQEQQANQSPNADGDIITELLAEIPDSHFASVLNNEGRIRIADTLYQFQPGNKEGIAYAIPERHIDQIMETGNYADYDGVVPHVTSLTWMPFMPSWGDNEDLNVIPVPGYVPSVCSFPQGFLFNWWGQKGGDIYYDDHNIGLAKDNGRTVKINYHRWRVGYIFYTSAGVRVKTLKDTRFGGWMSNVKMDQANIQACMKGKILTPGIAPIPFQSSTNITGFGTNEVEKTMKWIATIGIPVEIGLEHFNMYFKAIYQGQTISRNIRE